MPKSSNSKRHRILGMAAALAVAVVVILVIAIVVVIVRRPADVTPGAQVPVTTTPPLTRPGQKPRPAFRRLPRRAGADHPGHLGVVAHRRPA